MAALREIGSSGNIERFYIVDKTTGQPVIGLSDASPPIGLIISTIRTNETAWVDYADSAGNIQTIATLGTYVAPSSGKCRFREVGNGLYEFQFLDSRYASGAAQLVINVKDVASPPMNLQAMYEIELVGYDPQTIQPTVDEMFLAFAKRDWTGITGEAFYSMLNSMRATLNKWGPSSPPGFMHTYKEDATTVAFTREVASSASAEPITELGDPG